MAVRAQVRRIPRAPVLDRSRVPLPLETRERAPALRAPLLLGARGARRARRHPRWRGDRAGPGGPAGLAPVDSGPREPPLRGVRRALAQREGPARLSALA